jgi:hypothetical protein
MGATNLGERDAQLYRQYAVGLVGYEEALTQAENPSRLRRALLEFDQNARAPAAPARDRAA